MARLAAAKGLGDEPFENVMTADPFSDLITHALIAEGRSFLALHGLVPASEFLSAVVIPLLRSYRRCLTTSSGKPPATSPLDSTPALEHSTSKKEVRTPTVSSGGFWKVRFGRARPWLLNSCSMALFAPIVALIILLGILGAPFRKIRHDPWWAKFGDL